MEWRESERLRRKSLGVVVPWNPYPTVVISGWCLFIIFIIYSKTEAFHDFGHFFLKTRPSYGNSFLGKI